MIRIISPSPYRVYQNGYPFEIRFISSAKPLKCKFSVKKDENEIISGTVSEIDCEDMVYYKLYKFKVFAPAGGWFTLTVQSENDSDTVYPFGIGEVFVLAGQSHATNSNAKQFSIEDKEGRITVYQPQYGLWRIANDPQPCYDSGEFNARFGTFWPVTFDSLIKKIDIPIGLVNSAYGATALYQWMPGHEFGMYDRLVTCCRSVENFRAVLWQQGESDVMWHTTTEKYLEGMHTLKNSLDKDIGKNTQWIVAKSSIHPSTYTDPEHEKMIRDADDILWKTEGFHEGPDTDTLNKGYRDLGEFCGHLNENGQIAAGEMWSEILYNYLVKQNG